LVLRGTAADLWHRLMDAVDPALVGQAESSLLEVEGVQEVGEVRVRWIGHQLRAEVEVVVDCELSVVEGHDIAARAEHALLHAVPRLRSALVHFSPCDHDGVDHHSATAHHAPGHPRHG
ncbi:MAG: cation transporter dimerization domain-containing protein, partial [Acidimicrobiales bacterium]